LNAPWGRFSANVLSLLKIYVAKKYFGFVRSKGIQQQQQEEEEDLPQVMPYLSVPFRIFFQVLKCLGHFFSPIPRNDHLGSV